MGGQEAKDMDFETPLTQSERHLIKFMAVWGFCLVIAVMTLYFVSEPDGIVLGADQGHGLVFRHPVQNPFLPDKPAQSLILGPEKSEPF